MKPPEVTDDVRNELVQGEVKGLFNNLFMTVVLAILAALSIGFGYAVGEPKPRWSLSQIYSFQAVVVALVVAGITGAMPDFQ
jgi:hypothetical protein